MWINGGLAVLLIGLATWGYLSVGDPGRARMFSDPKVVAALKACGLAVPTRTPGGFRNQSPNPTTTGTA